MPFYDTTWYCNAGNQSTTGHYAVTKWATGATIAAGALRRQLAVPAVGSERIFVCIVAGTTHATTEPTWVLTHGAKTTDNTVTWQECTGTAGLNGDATNTANWTAAKAIGNPTLGAIIKRNNGASYQICTTVGALGASEPAFSDTAGVTTTDGTVIWTSLGVVGNFSGGGAPHARLASACASTWFAAGNTIYVGDNHAESQGSTITLVAVSSGSTVAKILCHNRLGSYPPTASDLMSGATVSTTATFAITMNFQSATYIRGIAFKGGVGGSTGSGAYITVHTPSGFSFVYFDTCSLEVASTVSGGSIQLGTTTGSFYTIFDNTTVKFANTADSILILNNQLYWKNTGPILVSGSSIPVTLFDLSNSEVGVASIILEAVDLSQLTGGLIFYATAKLTGNILVKDCKLNASMSVGTPTVAGVTVQLVRCDSGAIGYSSTRYQYEATDSTETSITRVGGAIDPTGQVQSRKIVTTGNAQWLRPFQAEPYAIWNAVTGSNVTVTVYGTINAGAVPNNDDIWLEIEYLGSSATPVGTIVNTTKSNLLAANAAVTSDGSSWNGGGSGAGWSPFKLTATLSSPQPGLAGYLYARVRAAKPSTTYYIDPKIVLT